MAEPQLLGGRECHHVEVAGHGAEVRHGHRQHGAFVLHPDTPFPSPHRALCADPARSALERKGEVARAFPGQADRRYEVSLIDQPLDLGS